MHLRRKKRVGGGGEQPPESQPWRQRCGAYHTQYLERESLYIYIYIYIIYNMYIYIYIYILLNADDAGVVWQSLVCAGFGLTVSSEAKTKIMCLRTKRMPEATSIFSVEAAGEVYNQTNEVGYLEGGVNHNTGLSIEVDR